MCLICLLTLNELRFNRHLYAHYVTSRDNFLADSLSHLRVDKFRRLAPEGMVNQPSHISAELWPLTKLWGMRDAVND